MTVSEIISHCEYILSVCQRYSDQIKVAFCEAPYLSTKSQALRDKFFADECIIEQKINQLNSNLQEINKRNGIDMPKFALDMKKSRKSNQSHKISFGLLKDEIHPDTLLSTYWLRRLINVVLQNTVFESH